MRIPVVYYGLVLLLWPLASPSQTVLPDSTIEQLRIGVRGFKERYHLPSIVVAIVHGNDILFSEALGYTDLEKNIPASIDSKYSIQSITKTFTATMYMQLAERGRVQKELAQLEQRVKASQGKLNNASFVEKAPAEVVEKERERLADLQLQATKLEERLKQLA